MRLAFPNRFKRAYQGLTSEEQVLANEALRLLAEDLGHPSLRVKKLRSTEGIWDAQASRSLRPTFEIHGQLLVFRTIGRHDEALGGHN